MGRAHRTAAIALGIRLGIVLGMLLACCPCAFALDPSLDITQYAHTAWKIREGFATGVVHQIAQTPDGYLWLASESGLLRFDGVRTVPWQPPPGERFPSNDVRGVIVARDGTLWLGTAKGLVGLKDRKLVHYPELDGHDVYALLEDHEGTVWAGGVVWEGAYSQPGKLCAIKPGITECYGSDGSFGFGVTAIHEDRRGNLWLGADNGLWRWKPGPSKKYALPVPMHGVPSLIFGRNAFVNDEHGGLIVAEYQSWDYPFCFWQTGAPIRCYLTHSKDRLHCCEIAMVVCGSVPWTRGLCICTREGLMCLRNPTVFLALLSKACSRIVRGVYGWRRRMVWIVFANTRFQ